MAMYARTSLGSASPGMVLGKTRNETTIEPALTDMIFTRDARTPTAALSCDWKRPSKASQAGVPNSRPFVVMYNSTPERIDIDIKAFPLLICLNHECISRLLQYISLDGPTDASEYLKKRFMRLVRPYM